MLTQIAKDNQEFRKEGRTFSEMLYQDIPVARDGLRDAIDVLGDPLPIDTDRMTSVAPFREEKTQAVWNWLKKNDLFISVPSRNSGGMLLVRLREGVEGPMTDAEYYRFMKKRGEMIKAGLQAVLPDLQKDTPAEAKAYLRKLLQNINPDAKMAAFSPDALSAADRADLQERADTQALRKAAAELENERE